ncbi:hypothetical protein RJT34_05137 [Clitoria ternatea]|uniref:N-acetyltransferase domain-containing protein n=1 Tax=Clitoria ternatea TaxID=43366 RepID=A0AAN9PTG5_CLITE
MDESGMSLRPFKACDAEDFLKWASDDRVTRYLRWNSITSKEEALAYIQNVAMPHPWRQSICIDDSSIGYVSVKPEAGDYRCKAHISYAVAAEYWGQGIATEALKRAIPIVFKQFPQLLRLEALVELDNIASQRVLHKVGFLREGLLRSYAFSKGQIKDFLIFSFLATDNLNS